MAVWVIRAGRHGAQETLALAEQLSVIGWNEMPDLSPIASREALREVCERKYPDASVHRISNFVGQLWGFRERLEVGDLVVLPLKHQSAVAIGEVKGPYRYRPDLPDGARHTRPTHWLRTDVPRAAFDEDLRYVLSVMGTVRQVQRADAEARVRRILAGEDGSRTSIAEHDEAAPPNLEEVAADRIREYISHRFKGHDLARLVDELLKAQGYRTLLSSPGPDGGTDILVGGGPIGFDAPRLCVQVKSSESPVDVKVFRELQGILKGFGAQQAVLVAWGGFKSSVLAESRRHFFDVRLWDSGDVVSLLLENYARLPADIQAEIPLKQIWTLVPEE